MWIRSISCRRSEAGVGNPPLGHAARTHIFGYLALTDSRGCETRCLAHKTSGALEGSLRRRRRGFARKRCHQRRKNRSRPDRPRQLVHRVAAVPLARPELAKQCRSAPEETPAPA